MTEKSIKLDLGPQQAKSLEKLLLRFLYKEEPQMLSFMDAINLRPIYERLSGTKARKLESPFVLINAEEHGGLENILNALFEGKNTD